MYLLLEYPKAGEDIYEHFVAYGYLRRGHTNVYGKLTDTDSGTEFAPSRTIYMDEIRWAMFFQSVDGDGPFVLQIYSDASPTVPIAESRNLSLEQSEAGLEIIHPLAGATVCKDFAAFGTTDQSESFSIDCKKIHKTGYIKNASDPAMRAGAAWAIFFSNVNSGDGYTLQVSHNADCSGGDQKLDIEVEG